MELYKLTHNIGHMNSGSVTESRITRFDLLTGSHIVSQGKKLLRLSFGKCAVLPEESLTAVGNICGTDYTVLLRNEGMRPLIKTCALRAAMHNSYISGKRCRRGHRGKTVGIVGFGTIGRLVAEKLQPFRVNLIATDPNVTPDDPDLAKYNVKLTTIEEVMSTSDIVTIHARTLTKERIIGKQELDLMKPTATLINTARAYLLDYDYLAQMLREERITGAALEVFPEEPLPADSPFIPLDNVTLTNHRGGDTVNCYSDSPEYLLTAVEKLIYEGIRPKFYIE